MTTLMIQNLVELDDEAGIYRVPSVPALSRKVFSEPRQCGLYYFVAAPQTLVPPHALPFDFGKDIFPRCSQRSGAPRYTCPEYIKDCGTPGRLDRVRADFSSGRVMRASLTRSSGPCSSTGTATINREVTHLSHHGQFELLPGVEDAIKRLNNSDYRTIVITNSTCSCARLQHFRRYKPDYITKWTRARPTGRVCGSAPTIAPPPGIGVCREVPELKIECDCRKPGTGLIERARRQLT